jgi:hypothetical protein
MNRLHLGDDLRELEFALYQTVYLRVRDEPVRGMVTGYIVDDNSVLYRVAWPSAETTHYARELTATFEPEYSRDAAEEVGE